MVFDFIARSGPGPDRNGLITDMDGWEFESFRANPVVFLNHARSEPAIGKSLRVGIDGEVMSTRIEFARTALALDVAGLIDGGFMAGISIGARTLEFDLVPTERGLTLHSHRQELVELSIVGIPADPKSLRSAMQGVAFVEGVPIECEPVCFMDGVAYGVENRDALAVLQVLTSLRERLCQL